MLRKLSILFAIALLAFTAACSSNTSSTSTAAVGATGTAASASATSCPTSNTTSFAKTKFVADVALAGGAFKRYIYDPAKAGKFGKGASGRTLAFVKAAAAGLFIINRLDAAKSAAEADPTLCKLLIAPMQKFRAEIESLVGKAKSGQLSSSDVSGASSQLDALHGAASSGSAGFTDNTSASVP